jgi:hypothetical protein
MRGWERGGGVSTLTRILCLASYICLVKRASQWLWGILASGCSSICLVRHSYCSDTMAAIADAKNIYMRTHTRHNRAQPGTTRHNQCAAYQPVMCEPCLPTHVLEWPCNRSTGGEKNSCQPCADRPAGAYTTVLAVTGTSRPKHLSRARSASRHEAAHVPGAAGATLPLLKNFRRAAWP